MRLLHQNQPGYNNNLKRDVNLIHGDDDDVDFIHVDDDDVNLIHGDDDNDVDLIHTEHLPHLVQADPFPFGIPSLLHDDDNDGDDNAGDDNDDDDGDDDHGDGKEEMDNN